MQQAPHFQMEQKLIFLDIDGTLTEPGKNIPPASAVEAVCRARKNGHKVVLCSGRNYGLLSPLLQFGFDGFISSAGGYIEYGGHIVYDCPMTRAQQDRVLKVLQENGVYYIIETRNHSYSDESFKEFLKNCIRSDATSELLRWQKHIESDQFTRPMTEYHLEPIYKAVFMSPGMDRLQNPIQCLQDEFHFCIQDENAHSIINGDLINKAFDKGTAVQRLCGHLDIAQKDTIAFGDSMNDLEMLQTAALGICMENGSMELKRLADEICSPFNEDGLYKSFEKLNLI